LGAVPELSKKLITVPNARHGEAFNTNKEMYLKAVFDFLDDVVPSAAQK
jgi:hypothetical protein